MPPLVHYGMSTRIAQKLATTQDEALIREKVEYLDFLQEERPEKVKNPTGWLRRAIEEDYRSTRRLQIPGPAGCRSNRPTAPGGRNAAGRGR